MCCMLLCSLKESSIGTDSSCGQYAPLRFSYQLDYAWHRPQRMECKWARVYRCQVSGVRCHHGMTLWQLQLVACQPMPPHTWIWAGQGTCMVCSKLAKGAGLDVRVLTLMLQLLGLQDKELRRMHSEHNKQLASMQRELSRISES